MRGISTLALKSRYRSNYNVRGLSSGMSGIMEYSIIKWFRYVKTEDRAFIRITYDKYPRR